MASERWVEVWWARAAGASLAQGEAAKTAAKATLSAIQPRHGRVATGVGAAAAARAARRAVAAAAVAVEAAVAAAAEAVAAAEAAL